MTEATVIIDNYDSFVYNLAQYVGELGGVPLVFRHDAVTPADIEALRPGRIIISPGPGTPEDAGVSCAVIRRFAGKVPILGICLGHQCLGAVFGARVVPAPRPTHGKSAVITHDGRTVFTGLPNPLTAGRYHSLMVDRNSLPPELEISAESGGIVMGLRHRRWFAEGLQFHPESVLTPDGKSIIRNFLSNDAGVGDGAGF